MKILVRAPNWIGDQVMAYPFFHYLRKAYPRAQITSVCVPWVSALQFRDLVDEVVELPRAVGTGLWSKISALEEGATLLRARGPWDLGISLPNSLSAAWLLRRAGARERRGYASDGRSLLLTQPLRWDADPGRHRAQAYIDLLSGEARPARRVQEFWGIEPENPLDPYIPGELTAFDAAKSWPLAELGSEMVDPPAEPYWVLAPGSTAESRRWPPEYMMSLARLVAAEKGWRGVVVGGPSEAPLAETLCSDDSLRLLDRTAQGPVTGLARLFRGAEFTLTNESGLAHVASLCGSRVQIVCGAADPRRTRPIGPGKVQISINPLDCWPCERNTCSEKPENQLRCLRGIKPDAVWEEVKRAFLAR